MSDRHIERARGRELKVGTEQPTAARLFQRYVLQLKGHEMATTYCKLKALTAKVLERPQEPRIQCKMFCDPASVLVGMLSNNTTVLCKARNASSLLLKRSERRLCRAA